MQPSMPSMPPSVLALRPLFVEKLWGGARLRELPAKRRPGHAPPDGVRVGESWEAADLPEGATVVDGGPLDGRDLRELVEHYGRALVGERAQPGPDGVLRFPLLVKLIDAGDDLSVQVHPDDAWARAHPGTFAKDEAWLVVDLEPGAKVLHGVRDGVTREGFLEAVKAGRAHELLREVRVSVGDVLRIAPGTMHAVGRGCLLLEVQEPSDTTYRVWDYERTDAQGRKRPLHVEQAMAVARFGRQDPPLVGDARPGVPAIKTSLYTMTLDEVGPGEARVLARRPGEPAVVFVVDGTVCLDDVELPAGASALVPAAARDVLARSEGRATFVILSTGA
jgi:mannose-6-phosphate isomerase